MEKNNRFLFITPDKPLPPLGGGTRSFHTLKAISRIGNIDLVVLSEIDNKSLKELAIFCSSVTFPKKNTFKKEKQKRVLRLIQYSFPFLFSPDEINIELGIIVDYHSKLLHPIIISILYYWFKFWMLFKSNKPSKSISRNKSLKLLQKDIQYLITTNKYNNVVLDFSYLYPIVKSLLPNNVRVITNSHNIEFSIYDQLIQKENSYIKRKYLIYEKKKLKKWELNGYAISSTVLCCSDADKFLIMHNTKLEKPPIVIPNGVDSKYFTPSKNNQLTPNILFTGTFGYLPNDDAMTYFITKIYPHIKKTFPQLTFTIAGKGASSLLPYKNSYKDIVLIDSPKDMRPIFNKAWAYIVPLRYGGGTRLKILEAWSMGKAVISTPIGIEGIIASENINYLQVKNVSDWLIHISSIINNKSIRESLEKNALKAVEKYDWVDIEKKITYNL